MSKLIQVQSTNDFPSRMIDCIVLYSVGPCVTNGFNIFGLALQKEIRGKMRLKTCMSI